MRVADVNWMQLEDYLRGDDRIVLPLGSVEQHSYLSLAVDQILSERVSVEARSETLGDVGSDAESGVRSRATFERDDDRRTSHSL